MNLATFEPIPVSEETFEEDSTYYSIYRSGTTDLWIPEEHDNASLNDVYVRTVMREERLYSSLNASFAACYQLNQEPQD